MPELGSVLLIYYIYLNLLGKNISYLIQFLFLRCYFFIFLLINLWFTQMPIRLLIEQEIWNTFEVNSSVLLVQILFNIFINFCSFFFKLKFLKISVFFFEPFLQQNVKIQLRFKQQFLRYITIKNSLCKIAFILPDAK